MELKDGLQQNSELLANGRVGLQGFAEIGVELHVFDRNRGNVQAARAEVERARQEVQRVNLSLRARTLPVSGRSALLLPIPAHGLTGAHAGSVEWYHGDSRQPH